eukprot:6755755-Karenia_brevis.AAC.1
MRFLYNLYGRHGSLLFWNIIDIAVLPQPVGVVSINDAFEKFQLFTLHSQLVYKMMQQTTTGGTTLQNIVN